MRSAPSAPPPACPSRERLVDFDLGRLPEPDLEEVAAHLFLSRRTVEYHMRNIFAKLGVRSRVELVKLVS